MSFIDTIKLILRSEIFRKIIKVVYFDKLKPIAEQYVRSTENVYDDKVLDFLDDLITHLLGEK